MLFNSYFFVFIYLPIVMSAFYVLSFFKKQKLAQVSLLIASLFFYGFWDIRFLPLLSASILFNFCMGNLIFYSQDLNLKRLYLYLGLGIDLAALFYFKYLNFLIDTAGYFLSSEINLAEIILPLGISFFTFTQIAYLVDVYQTKAVPGNFSSYSLFVTVFPHLIAGPILHHKEMMDQFEDEQRYKWSSENCAKGIFLFTMGLTKKILIADNISLYVASIYNATSVEIPFLQAWVGAVAYAVQLYFDFSGYSDMAIGLGLLFNLKLPLNFDSPYKADSIIDFWRRWHISLSSFLRNYLYIPLGGNRHGEMNKLQNLFLTMLLGGIWHGANWTFVIWGMLHGSFLIVNHLWRKLGLYLPHFISKIITLFCVIVAFAIFRAQNIEVATNIIKGLFGLNGFVLPESYSTSLAFLRDWGITFKTLHYSNVRLQDLLIISLAFLSTLLLPNSTQWTDRFLKRPVMGGLVTAAAFVVCVTLLDSVTEFLYYQF